MKYLYLLIIPFLLSAELKDHFKPAPNKSEANRFGNIDFVYMINLDQRPEKFKMSLEQLMPYGVLPYRFSAVNGWELSLADINDVGLNLEQGMKWGELGTCYRFKNLEPTHEPMTHEGQTYFVHCMARGTIGIALSHLSVLQDAYDSEYELIWVMEDDIEVVQDPNMLPDMINQLDLLLGYRNWDVLFTDRDYRGPDGVTVPCFGASRQRPDFDLLKHNDYSSKYRIGNFDRIGARFGAHSMILTRSGVEKILKFAKKHKIYMPYDMDFVFPEGIRMYCVSEDIVTNALKALSDNGGPHYLKKKPSKPN